MVTLFAATCPSCDCCEGLTEQNEATAQYIFDLNRQMNTVASEIARRGDTEMSGMLALPAGCRQSDLDQPKDDAMCSWNCIVCIVHRV